LCRSQIGIRLARLETVDGLEEGVAAVIHVL
jgi:hypothetical protein